MADRTETIILETEIDVESSIESIDNLTKANKELRKERNALNLQSEAGKKRAQEINHILDDNTNKIKTNVSALEKQKINIGNYKSALDGVHPALGKVGEGLEAGTSGLKSMTVQALRFIATPIGAILAGLVAVFTLLKTALSQNDALMDKFENVTHAVGVVLEVVTARIGKLGEALIKFASGDFSGAIDTAAEAFSGLGDEIANAVRQQQLFLDASRELEDSQISLSIKTAKYENEIKRLVIAAKDRGKTFDEQEKLLRESLALEEELIKEKTELARQDLIITARQTRSAAEFQQQENENTDQYIKRLLESEQLGYEEKKKIADKVNALTAAQGESLPFQEKIANTLSAIDEKRAAALEKLNAALNKNTDAERAARIARFEREQQTPRADDPLADAFDTQIKLETDLTGLQKEQLDERAKNYKDYWDKRNADAAKAADLEVQVERQKVAIIGNLVGSLATLAAEDSEARKVFASAQALINTYLAATAAYASGSEINVFFGVAAAAAAVAAGLANVARINNVEFAEGGLVLKGKSHAQGGIPIVAEGNEIIMTKGVYQNPELRRAASAINVAGGGRSFADGGLVTSSVSQPINQQLELLNIVKNIPPGEVSVVEISRKQNRIKGREKISKR